MGMRLSFRNKLRFYRSNIIDWWYDQAHLPYFIYKIYNWLGKPWRLWYLDGNPTLGVLMCRRRGHAGVVYWNPGGYEPDMHCKRCGEDLG